MAFVLLGHFSPLRDKTNLKFQRLVQERAEILICIKEFKRHERDGGLGQKLGRVRISHQKCKRRASAHCSESELTKRRPATKISTPRAGNLIRDLNGRANVTQCSLESRRAAQLPERPSSACSSSTLRGDLRTSAPRAYLPAVSASGTCAYRRAARAARRPDLMDKPSLQTALINKLVWARPATPAPLSGQVMPTVHVFHNAGRMHLSWGVATGAKPSEPKKA